MRNWLECIGVLLGAVLVVLVAIQVCSWIGTLLGGHA